VFRGSPVIAVTETMTEKSARPLLQIESAEQDWSVEKKAG
jgi:hypothetical protein